jgi:type I restriction enzyme S subunit
MVDLFAALDDAHEAAASAANGAALVVDSVRENWVGKIWRQSVLRPMGQLLDRIRRPMVVEPTEMYRELGVRSHGRGTFQKPPIRGSELGRKGVFEIHPGDLVFNIVFAWEGAVAVATAADLGRCGSHRFPTYVPRDGAVIEYVRELLLSRRGHELLSEASPGSAGRNRTLNQGALMGSPVPIPSVAEQRALGTTLAAAREVVEAHERNLEALATTRQCLLRS